MGSPKREEEKAVEEGGNSSSLQKDGGDEGCSSAHGPPDDDPPPSSPPPPPLGSTQETHEKTSPPPSSPTDGHAPTTTTQETVTRTQSSPPLSDTPETESVPAATADQGTNITITVPVTVGRKRRGNEGGSSTGSGAQKGKRKPIEANVPPVCAICSRSFNSFNALFGHMRAHKDKPWGRGAFPPPMAMAPPPTTARPIPRDQQEEQAVTDMVAAAQMALDQLDKPRAQLIDLNVKPVNVDGKEEEEEEEHAPPPTKEEEPALGPPKKEEEEDAAPPAQKKGDAGLDLNCPPPKEDDA